MIRKLLPAIVLLLPIAVLGQGIKPASESEQTILSRSEIVDSIKQVKSMPVQKQKEMADRIWAADAESKTPRSDFIYCSALAYLNHYKAQVCLARAFENGRGVVSDLTDAYVWYTIALENTADAADIKAKAEAAQAGVKTMLLSVYPSPSDFELEEAVNMQKEQIRECVAEAGAIGH